MGYHCSFNKETGHCLPDCRIWQTRTTDWLYINLVAPGAFDIAGYSVKLKALNIGTSRDSLFEGCTTQPAL